MNKYQPLVSCVIPVYNAEKYLDQGIHSLLSQTYNNIEIILVDDQSKDNSWEICQSYSKIHDNIRAYRLKNNSGGPLRGREKGILESGGEWITFMDCDDYVEPKYIENLVDATHLGEFDIAVSGHARLYPDGRLEKYIWKDFSQTTQQRLISFYENFLPFHVWVDPTDSVGQFLVRASICKETNLSKYSNTVYAEDTLMALAFIANSKNGLNYVDKHDFIWRQVEGSGSHGGFSDRANQPEFFKACFDIFHDPSVYNIISGASSLVSVIIPIYNTEQYLEDCIESVIRQSYNNLEIILVNDGSTDDSQKIIDKFKKMDHRIVTLEQQNQGLNMARAAGSRIAKGKYISYIDSDDAVHEDYIRCLYENLLTNDVDISIAGFRPFTMINEVNENRRLNPNYHEKSFRSRNEIINYYLGELQGVPNVEPVSACGKLYKAHLIKATDWHFSNYRRHEDNFESLQWYSMATSGIAMISDQPYFYRNNPSSITRKLQPNVNPDGKSLNYFEFIYEMYEKIKQYLNDRSFDTAALNSFANINSLQTRNFFFRNQLDEQNMESATRNAITIISLYNQQIQQQNQTIHNHEEALRLIYTSWSWRVTRLGRGVKKVYRRAKRHG